MSSIHSIGSRAASVRSFHRQNSIASRNYLGLPRDRKPTHRSAPVSPVKTSLTAQNPNFRRLSNNSEPLQVSKPSLRRRSTPCTSTTHCSNPSTSSTSLNSFEIESESSYHLSSGSICTLSSFLSSTSFQLFELFFSQVIEGLSFDTPPTK